MTAIADEKRKTGAEDVVWDLTPLYDGVEDPAIQRDLAAVQEAAQGFTTAHRGAIARYDAPTLRAVIEEKVAIEDKIYRLLAFAMLNFTTDSANPQFGMLMQAVMEAKSKVDQALVFFELEWNAVPEDAARNLIADPALRDYAHHLEAQRRYEPHQLPEDQEKLILDKDVTGIQAWERFFGQFTSALRYEVDGKQLTQSEVLTQQFAADRAVRQASHAAITRTLKDNLMPLGYIINVVAADKATDDRLRGYQSWIASRNMSNKAPDAVVEALINTVTSNYEVVARHYRLKRALLGLDELTEYDRYAPLPTKDSDQFYTWEQAREIVLNAFYAFNDEMGDAAKRFFDENWIHAAPGDNKRGGAYAHPVTVSAHPYVFMNYNGKPRDVMTLAHELGHGVHMLLSGKGGILYDLSTPLTTAETASTFAEMLVFHDLLSRETDAEVKLSMLAQKIEDSFSTIFRQVAMNRFEDALHRARREKGELGTEQINALWMGTQRAMYGDSVNLTDDYGVWWSYIPHFISTPGYVYAYAFGELLVLALYNIYQREGESFVPKYVAALTAGNSDYPDVIMREVGVDLNDPNFWQEGIDALAELVTEEEALAREVYPEKF
ncbi:MAG: M3 family oligoendopeptidase [Anaerolineaceae bacterium]|nr:MAG: M3 family oligoendopeptidase [Anaerolineaceae bacterium]